MMQDGVAPRIHRPRLCRRALALVLALGALLCAACLLAPAPAHCEEPARLSLEPSAPIIVVGEEVTLTVRVQEVANLYGIDLRLDFDPEVLEILDIDPAKEGVQSTPGRYPYPDLEARNEADNGAGTIWYMVTQLGAREAVSGTGTVATIHLRGKAAGTGAITVRQADLASNEGFMIPMEAGDASITVTDVPAGGGNDNGTAAETGTSPIAAAAMGVAVAGAVGALLLARGRRGA